MDTPPTPINHDIESILRGHPYKAIVRLAWPTTISMLLATLFNFVNLIWVAGFVFLALGGPAARFALRRTVADHGMASVEEQPRTCFRE